jgi:hypothetical protein
MARKRQSDESGSQDLREREYRDKEGNVRHHIRTSRSMREKARESEKKENK